MFLPRALTLYVNIYVEGMSVVSAGRGRETTPVPFLRENGIVTRLWGLGAALIPAALLVSSCGGSSPSGPSTPPGSGGNASIPITMTATGVNPKQLTVAQGTRVLFVDNDVRTREMTSDPHPEHNDCPEINNVGFIGPGQTKETGNLNTIRTCGYHDHGNPDDVAFRGQIIIH